MTASVYAIIDIETTGGNPAYDRITEIAVFLHNGREVTGEYSQLINPERQIPPYITALTGISNEMVAGAPRFCEIARKLVELTEGRIFVAHNAAFDYGFIREEFKNLGYDYKRKQLCTVKLSRKLIPGHSSYSLGKLCKELDIEVYNRHRAAGDAFATVRLFELLLSLHNTEDPKSSLFGKQAFLNLHPSLSPEQIEALPQETGVYYFLDEQGKIIYIGKSKNLYQRVITHLQNVSSQRKGKMRDSIASIDYELTGSELIALLKESDEIKKHRPEYNRKQKQLIYSHGLFSRTDEQGFLRFSIERITPGKQCLATFPDLATARETLENMVKEHGLCQKLSGLYTGQGPCFHYQVGLCKGACAGKESPADYNPRAGRIIRELGFRHHNFFILENGRKKEEMAVIKIANGRFCGYGYADTSLSYASEEELSQCIRACDHNQDSLQIIRKYLQNGKNHRILPY